jgi:hypothetical protein
VPMVFGRLWMTFPKAGKPAEKRRDGGEVGVRTALGGSRRSATP